MLNALATSLSGMNAARTALDVAGHNIANLATEGFHRQQAENVTRADGGVDTRITRSDAAGADPAADLVGELTAKNAFLANVSVFRTADRMLGALLDDQA